MSIVVGIDAHKASLTYIALSREGTVVQGPVRVPNLPEVLRGMTREFPGALFVIEACGMNEWMMDVFRAEGARVKAVVPIKRPDTRGKNDPNDALRTARHELAKGTREVYVGPPSLRRDRDIVRHRADLVDMRTGIKNQLHHGLNRWGFSEQNPLLAEELKDRFSPDAKVHITREFPYTNDHYELVKLLDRQIKSHDADVKKIARTNPIPRRLASTPGVGNLTAVAFYTDIGDIKRFPSAEHLVSYVGLDPVWGQSGDSRWDHHHISKSGRDYLRGLLTEAAWVHVRCCKESSLTQAFNELTKSGKPPKKAILKVARLLAKTLYTLWKEDRDFTLNRPAGQRHAGATAKS